MTINAAGNRVSFNCDGVTTLFPVPLQAYLAVDFTVILTAPVSAGGGETTLTLNSAYTLATNSTDAPPKWALTTTGASPYASGYVLEVFVSPQQVQQTSYVQGQAFPSLAIQTNLDRLTQMVQRLQDQISRTLRAPDGDVSPLLLLPPAASRALLFTTFDASGNVQLSGNFPATTFTQSIFNAFLGTATLYPQTGPEAALTVVNFFLAPGNVLRYGTNTTPGTTNMQAAFQAAFNQQSQGGANVYVPSGSYLVTSTVTTSPTGPFVMTGDGMGRTLITKTGDTDLFQITASGSAYSQITIENLTVSTTTAMVSGAAFNINGAAHLPSVSARNVMSICSSTSQFKAVWNLTDCAEANFTRCFNYGTVGLFGWLVQNTQSASVMKFVACSCYGIQVPAAFSVTTTPGIEGVQFYGCDFTGCTTGVSYDAHTSGYFPPQITWEGGHINASTANFSINTATQFSCTGAALYNSGNSQFFSLTNVSDLNIVGNIMQSQGGATPSGITLGATGTLNGGMIANNVMRLGSGTGNGINLLNAPFMTNLTITGNQMTGGLSFCQATGAIPNSCVITNNTPRDQADIYDTSLTFAATMSLAGIRADYAAITAPGGATTCTALTSRRAWDRVTLTCPSVNATLQNNNTNPDGFALAGGTNYTFTAAGSKITLEKRNGGYWTEVARD